VSDRLCLGCGRTAEPADLVCSRCGRSLAPSAAVDGAAAHASIPDDVARAAEHPDNCFGPYVKLRPLGQGASGEVWLGWHRGLRRHVAIKLMTALGPHAEASEVERLAEERFLREASTVARLRHPRIVAVHDAGVAALGGLDRIYIAMDYLPGGTLSRDPRPLRDQVAVLADVADALDHAHSQGVVHRDVKPANVLLDDQGRGCLSDFGLARVTDATLRTASGLIMGTPGYMSPEQAGGDSHRVDGRSDIYSLGVILYERLAGRLPHQASSTIELVAKIVNELPDPPSRVRAGADRQLEAVCLRAMAKEPGRRFSTAREMAEELRRWLAGEPVRVAAPGLASRWSWHARRRWKPAAAALVLLVAGAAAAIALRRPAPSPAEAQWITVWGDDFERTELGPGWTAKRGTLTIHDGALCARNAHFVLPLELADEVRMEYRAVAPPDADVAKEMSCFISGSAGNGLADGYSFEVGIYEGTKHSIQRLHWDTWGRPPEKPLAKGRSYRIVAERRRDRLRLAVDGQTVLEVTDPAPIGGADHDRAGIGSQCSHLHYDDLRVFVPAAQAEQVARALADRGFALRAGAIFAEIEKSLPAGSRRDLLALRRAATLEPGPALVLAAEIRARTAEVEVLLSALELEAGVLATLGREGEIWRRLLASWPALAAAQDRARGLHTRAATAMIRRRPAAEALAILDPVEREWRAAHPTSAIAIDLANHSLTLALAAGRLDEAAARLDALGGGKEWMAVEFRLAFQMADRRHAQASARLRRALATLSTSTFTVPTDRAFYGALEILARRLLGEEAGPRIIDASEVWRSLPHNNRVPARIALAAAALIEGDLEKARAVAVATGEGIDQEPELEYAALWRGESPALGVEIRREADFVRALRALADRDDEKARRFLRSYLESADHGDYRAAARAWLK
jgi:hypothetical protein